MAGVELRGVRKSFGPLEVIRGVDLSIADKSFVAFVGPSGCGKSTLLRMIAGLEDVSAGEISIGERRVDDLAPAERGIAMVFQSYALYPHMSVRENMEFGLRMAGVGAAEREDFVTRAARTLRLEGLLARRPRALSGGQRQRVAIGRAIVRDPDVFLFDEPLSNLDAALRVQMRVELARLHRELARTMIYVTHDQVEAMTLADRIVVLDSGRVEQVGAPMDLYRRPANLFVAGFIGSPKMNFLECAVETAPGGGARVRLAGGTVADLPHAPRGDRATLGIRPEHLVCGPAATDLPRIAGKPVLIERLGGSTLVHLALDGDATLTVQAADDAGFALDVPVSVGLPPGACHLFGPDGVAWPQD
jgi:multiple sugar transport system ATP-binding protein